MSENRENLRALRISRALFPGIPLRFVGDSGLDDQIFAQVARVDGQFIFRVKHEDRLVEVYNERLQRWEGPEHLTNWPPPCLGRSACKSPSTMPTKRAR